MQEPFDHEPPLIDDLQVLIVHPGHVRKVGDFQLRVVLLDNRLDIGNLPVSHEKFFLETVYDYLNSVERVRLHLGRVSGFCIDNLNDDLSLLNSLQAALFKPACFPYLIVVSYRK